MSSIAWINKPSPFPFVSENPLVYKINHNGVDYSLSNFKQIAIPDRDNAKLISFVSPNQKALLWISPKFFHAIRDFLFQVISMHFGPSGPYHFIVDIRSNNLSSNDYNRVIFNLLNQLGITYSKFDSSEYDYIEVNNCAIIGGFQITEASMLAFDKIKSHLIKNQNIVPYRKVYVSRKLRDEQNDPIVFTDPRIVDHAAMEKIFQDAGFEIAYPETFANFEDQIQYFYETKVLASVTGSGLTNSLFMQPNNTIIEIVSPILLPHFDQLIHNELHHYYKELAYLKDHNIINIPNKNDNFENLKLRVQEMLKFC